MFKRSLLNHRTPDKPPTDTAGLKGCPNVLELETGDYVIIGIRSTASLRPHLPTGTVCGPDEEMIVVPKRVFEDAARSLR